MFPIYPEIKPYARHRLRVDDIHELYIDESGTPEGIPVVFLHGGPGSGCEFNSRCFFDPEKYRIILFDQRGSGRSLPHSSIERNTTELLIEDIEKIREFLEIDRWLVFGGGWGATLGLAYAEEHADKLLGMVLRGLFLGRVRDIAWIYQDGANRIFPDHWEDYKHPIPLKEHGDFVKGFYDKLTGPNELARMGAAKAWSVWEAQCSSLHLNQRLLKHYTDPRRSMARAMIGTHYFINHCFLEEDQLLSNAHKIEHLPGIIVHGRFDVMSPLENSHSLHKVWPNAQLYIIREAGHSATEPAIIDALIRATRDMALRFEADFPLIG